MTRTGVHGPCLYPGTPRCGAYHAYTNLGCRGEDCREASRIYTQQRRNPEIVNEVDDPLSLIRQLVPAGDWINQANCRGASTETFFPGHGERNDEARAICAGCTVINDCLDYALTNGEKFGVWGGTSENERRKMRRAIA